jgi:DNA-binding CsgD family transcriptional regulator
LLFDVHLRNWCGMPEAELLALVGEIYEAALDAARWGPASENSSESAGVHASSLDSESSKGRPDFGIAAAEEVSASIATRLRGLNPGSEERTRSLLTLLVPHIQRASLIGRTIALNRAAADAFADISESLVAGWFLIGSNRRLLRANRAGQALLADEAVLRESGGRLFAADPRADRALHAALARSEKGESVQTGPSLAIPLSASAGHRHVAHLLPLTSGSRRKAGPGYAAIAAIAVRKLALDVPAAPEIIAEFYGLTPAELRVLFALVEFGGVSDIAGALGVSPGTAKTHLRRLFAKTGTRRQVDLVKLVAGFAPP